MLSIFDPLREFTFGAVLLRLLLAALCGGAVGYGRSQRARPAGLRTYMLVCIGATLSVLVTLYDYEMLKGPWAEAVEAVGEKFDTSRLAAQVITGIGFLGAGIIIEGAHHKVQGLTTDTGLFTTVCMGLAIGAGFYECAILATLLLVLVLNVMSPLEIAYRRRVRNITLNVSFNSVEDIDSITQAIKALNAQVYEIDVECTERHGDQYPSAIFILQMDREHNSHSGMLSSVAELDCVHSVQELIS